MNYKIRKTAEQLANEYFPVGDKGPELGGDADQESESPEEINDAMESQDQENYQPAKDNIIIDKNNNPGDKFASIIAELEKLAILYKSGYIYDIIKSTIIKIKGS